MVQESQLIHHFYFSLILLLFYKIFNHYLKFHKNLICSLIIPYIILKIINYFSKLQLYLILILFFLIHLNFKFLLQLIIFLIHIFFFILLNLINQEFVSIIKILFQYFRYYLSNYYIQLKHLEIFLLIFKLYIKN